MNRHLVVRTNRVLLALGLFIGVGIHTASLATAGTLPGSGWGDAIQANEPVIFSVMGDMPYGESEIAEFQQQIDQHDLYSPSEFLNHVGDIKSGSEACSIRHRGRSTVSSK